MGMTFAQQQTKLSSLLGDSNTGTDDQWPLATRQLELNRGELKLAEEAHDLLGYASGTISSQAITLPSDFLELGYLLIGGDTILTGKDEISIQEYQKWINSGEDKFYFWVNSSNVRQILFIDSNSNSQAYVLYYYRGPSATLSDDSDESDHQDQFREAPVYYAAGELLPQIGKYQLANYWKGQFEIMARKAEDKTKKLVMEHIRAYPDIVDEGEFEKDIQGRGLIA